jgi:hypothetical protein
MYFTPPTSAAEREVPHPDNSGGWPLRDGVCLPKSREAVLRLGSRRTSLAL